MDANGILKIMTVLLTPKLMPPARSSTPFTIHSLQRLVHPYPLSLALYLGHFV